jgi:hypothetical protein
LKFKMRKENRKNKRKRQEKGKLSLGPIPRLRPILVSLRAAQHPRARRHVGQVGQPLPRARVVTGSALHRGTNQSYSVFLPSVPVPYHADSWAHATRLALAHLAAFGRSPPGKSGCAPPIRSSVDLDALGYKR